MDVYELVQLRETIVSFVKELVLTERLRNQFNLEKFKNLGSITDVRKYAFETLQEIGLGSTRAVYHLSSRSALKVAETRRGIEQNRAEWEGSLRNELADLAIKVYSRHPRYWWLITELVRPLHSEKEFEKRLGISQDNLRELLENPSPEEEENLTPFLKTLLKGAREARLVPFDVARYQNWGVTPDGRPVLLDIGFTEEVRKANY